MVYKNSFVAYLRDSNKVNLRETDGVVKVPFYEEYILVLKNKNSRKAVAEVFIDGQDALGGKKLILSPNETIELERFTEDLEEGRRFQFVPKSDSRISDKKNHPDLGIIEVKFTLEKHQHPCWVNVLSEFKSWEKSPWPYTPSQEEEPNWSINGSTTTSLLSATACSASIGGTAEGSRSTQKFQLGQIGELSNDSTTIRLRLLPLEKGSPSNTVEGSRNAYCTSCGTSNKTRNKFCYNCGEKIVKK